MSLRLLQGSAAMVEAAIAAECRFFAGYPMSPFTSLLEQFSARLPASGGVCINADSEIEAVNMALGAGAAGFRSATGSCGQGLALMQEAIAEAALNETPLVLFNMARNQQDYFQATRGGGWGDYRTITLAPKNVTEAVEHTQLAFHLADLYRAPVLVYGDHFIADAHVTIDIRPPNFPPLPAKDWALDGSLGGTGRSRQTWTWAMGKPGNPGLGPEHQWQRIAQKFDDLADLETRCEADVGAGDGTVVVAFGTAAAFVEAAVARRREAGQRVGWFRPITLWPFPHAALGELAARVDQVLVFELNAGQMIDDVRIAVAGRCEVRPIGGVSIHPSGLRHGTLMDVALLEDRIGSATPERIAP